MGYFSYVHQLVTIGRFMERKVKIEELLESSQKE